MNHPGRRCLESAECAQTRQTGPRLHEQREGLAPVKDGLPKRIRLRAFQAPGSVA